MRLPELTEMATAKDNTEEFKGYNHNLRNEVGEWYDQKNMTTDYYPAASPRDKRSIQENSTNITIVEEINTISNTKINKIMVKDILAIAFTDNKLISLRIVYENEEQIGCLFMNGEKIVAKERLTPIHKLEGIDVTVTTEIGTLEDPQAYTRFVFSNLTAKDINALVGDDYLIQYETGYTVNATVTSIEVNTVTMEHKPEYSFPIGFDPKGTHDLKFINDTVLNMIKEVSSYFGTDLKTHNLVRMGSYICVFPEGTVYESANIDDTVPVYKIAQRIEPMGVQLQTVIEDNASSTGYTDIPNFEDSTSNTENYRISDGQVQYYVKNSGMWVAQQTYVKISAAAGTFDDFNEGDALYMKFECEDEMGDGDIADITAFYGLITYDWQKKNFNEKSIKILKKGAEGDYIIVNGFIGYTYKGAGAHTRSYFNAGNVAMSFTRKKPEIKFACESQNRIWACSKDGHEIYASALGNPYNFYDYSGLATDSYAVNVGTDGEFTGCINYMGQPLFFKENALHYISGSYPSNNGSMDGMSYAVTTLTDFKGVEKGSEKSFAIIDNILYYKSAAGIVAYDGANTVVISDALGKEKYKNAVAGAYKNKYYVSMQDKNGVYHLFVYDTELGTWCKEDNTQALQFIKVNNELLYADASDNAIHSVSCEDVLNLSSYRIEDDFDWECETGNFGYSYPNNKYLSRFQVRMQIADGAKATIYIQYNSDGVWHRKGEMTGKGVRTHLIPIVPIRCDHMKIKFAGKGDVKIFSIAKIFEEGGDV